MVFQRRSTRSAKGSPRRSETAAGGSWSSLRFFVTLILLAWGIRSFIVAPFSIPSGSMLPTLYIGDYLLVAKWPYGYSKYSFPMQIPAFSGRIFERPAKRGDVVVFRHPDEAADLIKRVIGVPGDTIEVRGGAVVLNGKPLERSKIAAAQVPISENSPCRTVPPLGSSLHYQGTMRMGASDDGTSVCDRHSRVWGFDNLFIAGNGVIPSVTATNPTLFMVSLATLGARALAAARLRPAHERL